MRKILLLSIGLIVVIGIISGCANGKDTTEKNVEDKDSKTVDTVEMDKKGDIDEKYVVTDNNENGEEQESVVLDAKSMEQELTPLAVEVIQAYAFALETHDKSQFHLLADTHVADTDVNNLLMGIQFSKDKFDQTVNAFLEENDDATRSIYVNDLRKVDTSKVFVENANINESSAVFIFNFEMEEIFGNVNVIFSYIRTDDGQFVLDEIRIG